MCVLASPTDQTKFHNLTHTHRSNEHRRKKDRSFVKKACFKAALQLLLGREERERERERAAHSLCSSLGCNLHGFLHNYPHLRVS